MTRSTADRTRDPATRRRTGRRLAALAAGAAALALTACSPARDGASATAPTATAAPTASATSPAPRSPSAAPTPPATPRPTHSTTRPASGTPDCRTADLSLAPAGSSGHAGSGTAYLALTNRSGRHCALAGFPEVRLVDGTGRALPVRVRHHLAAHRVVLAPGGAAGTAVTLSHVPRADDEGAPCEPPAAALRLTPPGGTGYLAAEGAWRACGGTVEVDSFTAGRPPAA
ncbi:hypothetical protein GCM10010169_25980 [Micromonospora fulviviridis]|uniref:DUF4232 domain-containing protein n=1 Tax=Micromonospora fulviviridis TaxID=47860 RepID=UPI00166A32E0|nr:DUF4232 domain-containing protein [Micromonospora fulviviridis]GGR80587.1 hypothetical protein GCM10010169_25980 [Micromonospora fulviviridis]